MNVVLARTRRRKTQPRTMTREPVRAGRSIAQLRRIADTAANLSSTAGTATPKSVAAVPSSFRLKTKTALASCGVVAQAFFPTRTCRRCDFRFGKTSRRGLSSSMSSALDCTLGQESLRNRQSVAIDRCCAEVTAPRPPVMSSSVITGLHERVAAKGQRVGSRQNVASDWTRPESQVRNVSTGTPLVRAAIACPTQIPGSVVRWVSRQFGGVTPVNHLKPSERVPSAVSVFPS